MLYIRVLIKYTFQALLFLCCAAVFQSCTHSQKEIRAYMVNNLNWEMVEECGYEGCYPMVDLLKGKKMTLSLEFDNDRKTKKYFVIRTTFTSVKNKVEYNPSNIAAKVANGEMMKPKVFTCSYTLMDLQYLRVQPSLQSPFSIKKYDCFLLFFDHPALLATDEAVMNINKALILNGTQVVDVPMIHFKKNIVAPSR